MTAVADPVCLVGPADVPAPAPLPSPYARWVKPAIDGVAALALLVVLLPVLAAVALAVRLGVGRPVIFRQERIGLGGRRFTVFKFRTMLDEPPAGAVVRRCEGCRSICHKCPNDPCHTRVGRVLRRFSLDELPQLVNVLRGEMSLVGPRPELPDIVAGYDAWQHRRHAVRPGLTGLWQVTQRSSQVPMHEATGPDIEYVERISLRTDLAILARTLPSVLGRHHGS